LARHEVERGTLTRVLPAWRLPARPLYAVFRRQGEPPRRVRLLIEFLSEWFERD
jgi:DNA-binding transcriptional LysR family regulator